MNRTILIIILLIVVVCGSGIAGIFIYIGFTGKYKSEHQFSVEKIENIGKLELVKINIKDVLEQTKERPLYLPNAKTVLIVAGEVLAGIDLEKAKKEDINVSGDKVTVKLPKPEIFSSKVNHEKSKVYNIEWGGFSSAELVDEAYRNAEIAIIESAKTTGYKATCQNNAKLLLTPIFREMSGKEVEILF